MSKLIFANLSRLKRDKALWIAAAAMFVLSVFSMINNGQHSDPDSVNNISRLNDVYFNLLLMIGFFYSVFISLFLGTEYSDGTIRNKIMIGHSRSSIYFSNFAVCMSGTFLIYIAMLFGSGVGICYFGMWQGTAGDFIAYLLTGLFITVALTAILTMISMLSTNKAITVVISIVISILLLMISSSLYNVLQEPEFTREFVSMSADGQVEFGPEIANPAYVSGWERKVDEWLVNFLPTGQSVLLANNEIRFPLNIIYSLIVTFIVTSAGVFAFRKKDLK